MQNFSFCGSGWSFWYLFLALFCHFFMQKFSFLRGWEVFFSKKTTFFFVQNFSFCGAGWSFWVKKWDFFEFFFSFFGVEVKRATSQINGTENCSWKNWGAQTLKQELRSVKIRLSKQHASERVTRAKVREQIEEHKQKELARACAACRPPASARSAHF